MNKITTLIGLIFLFCGFNKAFTQSVIPHSYQFIENKNQWESDILYRANINSGNLFLEKDAFTFDFYDAEEMEAIHRHSRIHSPKSEPENQQSTINNQPTIHHHAYKMQFINANAGVKTSGANSLETYNNYFIGNDKSKWASGVPIFTQIHYADLYPSVDMNIYTKNSHLKYEFVAKPQADISQIKIQYTGLDSIYISDGNLYLINSLGKVIEQEPVAYQLNADEVIGIPCEFNLHNNEITFSFPKGYNKNLPLVIDPSIVFATFSGSTADNWGFTATYDAEGSAYSGGVAFATGYPASTGAYQTTFNGPKGGQGIDIAIIKYDSTGTKRLFATYLGGSGNEMPHSMVVNADNELFVMGVTGSTNYPVTANAYDTSFGGGAWFYVDQYMFFSKGSDIIVTKFSQDGKNLLGSTYIGGVENDGMNEADTWGMNTEDTLRYNYGDGSRGEIILDANGNCYVASTTESSDFPVTNAAAQSVFGGGRQDAIVFKLNSDLSNLSWASFLGGNEDDAGYALALDDSNNVFVTGGTVSSNFPTTTGALDTTYNGGRCDGFIAHLKNDGSKILSSTYIGTTAYDQAFFIQLDKKQNVFVYGQSSGNYPVSSGVYSNANSGQFLDKLSYNLDSSLASTVVGTGQGVPDISPSAFLVDQCGRVYISGWGGELGGVNVSTSTTTGLPVTSDAYQKTTDGNDFYFMVLEKDFLTLHYATFFGGSVTEEHVDGGTSRFDKRGVIYQSICGGCGGKQDMPTTAGVWSNKNKSSNCNNALVKFKFDIKATSVDLSFKVSSTYGCSPFTANFSNSSINATNYQWNFGDTASLTQDTSSLVNPSHVYDKEGIYKVMLVGYNPLSCNMYDTTYKTVKVEASFKIDAGKDTALCIGDTVQLNVTGGGSNTTYSWLPKTGLSSYTDTSPKAFPTTTTTYIVSAVNGLCSAKDTIVITVNNKIVVTNSFTATPTSGCTPLTVAFNNTSTNATNYLWEFGDGDTSTLKNPSHFFSKTGIYSAMLIGTNSNSCSIYDTAHKTITVGILSLNKDSDKIICIGDTTQLVVTGGNGSMQYSWTPTTGLSNANIASPFAFPNTTTTYIVSASNGFCTDKDTVMVTVKPKTKADFSFTASPSDLCAPVYVVFTNTSTNGTSYLWNFGDGDTSQLLNPVHTYNKAGIYPIVLISMNPAACKPSIQAKNIQIYSPGKIDAGQDKTICSGETTQLLASGGTRYIWIPSVGLSNDTIANPTASPQNTTTYSVSLNDGTCPAKDSLTVTVNALPFIDAGIYKTIYQGEKVTLLPSGGKTYLWNPASGLSCADCVEPIASPTKTTLYTVTSTDANGCPGTDTVTVIVLEPKLLVPNIFTPNGDVWNNVFDVIAIGFKLYHITIYNRWGEKVFETNDANEKWNGKIMQKGGNAPDGVYYYILEVQNYLDEVQKLHGFLTLIR